MRQLIGQLLLRIDHVTDIGQRALQLQFSVDGLHAFQAQTTLQGFGLQAFMQRLPLLLFLRDLFKLDVFS